MFVGQYLENQGGCREQVSCTELLPIQNMKKRKEERYYADFTLSGNHVQRGIGDCPWRTAEINKTLMEANLFVPKFLGTGDIYKRNCYDGDPEDVENRSRPLDTLEI